PDTGPFNAVLEHLREFSQKSWGRCRPTPHYVESSRAGAACQTVCSCRPLPDRTDSRADIPQAKRGGREAAEGAQCEPGRTSDWWNSLSACCRSAEWPPAG